MRLSRYQDPHYVEVHLKASKTNPYHQGVTIFLGRVQSRLCPVAAVARYMVLRGVQPGQFFKFRGGRALTRERFVEAV